MSEFELDREAPVYVAGHRGLVGSAVHRQLQAEGFTNLIGRSSAELDLRNRADVFDFFAETQPEVVVLAAAKVGGILANNNYPHDFISENLQIQVNVLDAALEQRVPRLVFLGSSCIYPKFAEQPITEDSLLTGKLEPTNDAYAIAKIAGILQVQATRRQYGLPWISAMPTNLYGPGDNFDLTSSHVMPALIRKAHEAKLAGADSFEIWGSGTPLREFMHVDDLADACVFLLKTYHGDLPLNIGYGSDVSIGELAELVAKVVGFTGSVTRDTTKPDGTPRKLMDSTRLHGLGWAPAIALELGIADAYRHFLAANAG